MYPSLLVYALLHTVDDTPSLPVAPAPRPAVLQKLPTWRPTTGYYGEVMAVAARSITIRGNENNDNAPKISVTFPAGDALLRGEQDPREVSNNDYRLKDVKVGDIVYIMIHHSGEDNLCAAVRIQRRPGGEVPRAPFEPGDVRDHYHDAMNAYQRFEEKGIPLPLKYNLDFQRAVSAEERAVFEKQLAKLKHEDRMRLEGRIAPMPRPVVRK